MDVMKKVKELSESEQEMAHRLDLIQFQLDEIESANLEPKEDELLQEERRQIANFEKIYEAPQNAYNALRNEQAGLDWVGMASSELENVSGINEGLNKVSESVANAYYILEDSTFQIRNMLDELEYDPERLDYIESRLNEIKQLKRKYGATVEDIQAYSAKIEEEIDRIENRDSHLQALKSRLESIGKDVAIEADQCVRNQKKMGGKAGQTDSAGIERSVYGKIDI